MWEQACFVHLRLPAVIFRSGADTTWCQLKSSSSSSSSASSSSAYAGVILGLRKICVGLYPSLFAVEYHASHFKGYHKNNKTLQTGRLYFCTCTLHLVVWLFLSFSLLVSIYVQYIRLKAMFRLRWAVCPSGSPPFILYIFFIIVLLSFGKWNPFCSVLYSDVFRS